MSTKARPSPLRDRLLSNSPDPIKSSILRESGQGWSSPPTMNAATSPLRISKRSPSPPPPKAPANGKRVPATQLPARRSSNSYKHMRNNNLVSKSPFKSLLPTPSSPSVSPRPSLPFPTPSSPRRVSGEKRPRPVSLHDQAESENARPFSLKRERRQSKGFQGLIQKEPVTKSPFKRSETPQSKPLPAPPASSSDTPPPATTPPSTTPTPTATASPARSSLVSKRLHGPRTTSLSKRARRKTVTWDEMCDVVEFDAQSLDSQAFGSEDGYGYEDGEDDDEDENGEEVDMIVDDGYIPANTIQPAQDQDQDRESFDTIHLSPSSSPHTPPPTLPSMDIDADTENGVPYGRTHHLDRARLAHAHSPASTDPLPLSLPLPLQNSPENPSTPRKPTAAAPGSEPPLGRSTHLERVRAHRTSDVEVDVEKLPPSPSPVKHGLKGRTGEGEGEGLVPRFDLGVRVSLEKDKERGADDGDGDPFAQQGQEQEQIKDVQAPAELSFASFEHEHAGQEGSFASYNGDRSLNEDRPQQGGEEGGEDRSFAMHETDMDPANLSIGHSEVSLSALEAELGLELGFGLGLGVGDEVVVPSASLGPEARPVHDEAANGNGNESTREAPIHETSSAEYEYETASASSLPGADEERVRPHGEAARPERVDSALAGGTVGEPVSACVASPLPTRIASPLPSRIASPLPSRIASPLPSRIASPLPTRIASPRSTSTSTTPSPIGSAGGIGGRTPRLRISREDVQRRLMRSRSVDRGGGSSSNSNSSPEVKVDAGGVAGKVETGEKEKVEAGAEEEAKRMSVMTDVSFSAETATIERAEKRVVGSARLAPALSGGGGGMDVDVDMRSALDRLMDDVASAGGSTSSRERGTMLGEVDERGDESMRSEDADEGRGLLSQPHFVSPPASRSVSGATIPPAVPPKEKDAIKSREEMILEKRREARRREEGESMGWLTPPRVQRQREEQEEGGGRQTRRRSMSTGDVGGGGKRGGGGLLDIVPFEAAEDPLEDSINRELRKLGGVGVSEQKYHVRERQGTIYASSDVDRDRIEHVGDAGDVDGGKAWRTVRRPSDMNEYSKQIKEYRALEKPGKAHGKVFVRVLGVKGLNVPLPQQPTALTCTLNNGIHFVTTPECRLGRDCRIEQEFELIEHSKLEFTLTLKIRRDPHIIAQFKAVAPPPPPQPPAMAPSSSKGGMRSFFSSSPKKSSKTSQQQPPAPPAAPVENLARYLKPDGMLARAFVSFKDIASRCDTRLFETSYPLIGQRIEGGGAKTVQVGELVLQMFRLPPLPGIKPDELPQSLEECHRGLRHVNWHKVTYFEGTLTQNGGDCTTWRRRQLRVIGANLVAFNDVTKKATATIDIRKAIAVEDDQGERASVLSPASAMTARSSRHVDEYEGLYGVDRSFRLIFPYDQEIVFFADTDEEKAKWLEVLRALVGHIPPNPLWAELIWQRQHELSGKAVPAQGRNQTR